MFSRVSKRIAIHNNSQPCSMSALTTLRVFQLTNKAVFVITVEEFSKKINVAKLSVKYHIYVHFRCHSVTRESVIIKEK